MWEIVWYFCGYTDIKDCIIIGRISKFSSRLKIRRLLAFLKMWQGAGGCRKLPWPQQSSQKLVLSIYFFLFARKCLVFRHKRIRSHLLLYCIILFFKAEELLGDRWIDTASHGNILPSWAWMPMQSGNNGSRIAGPWAWKSQQSLPPRLSDLVAGPREFLWLELDGLSREDVSDQPVLL